MKQIDLDDLPPKLAERLLGLEVGEDLLLVQSGLIVGRLTASVPSRPDPAALDVPPPTESPAEVFEQFRSLMEDEF